MYQQAEDFDDDPRLLLAETLKKFEKYKKLTKDEEYQLISEIQVLRDDYKKILFNLKYVQHFLYNTFKNSVPEAILGRKKSTFYTAKQMKQYTREIRKYIRFYEQEKDSEELIKILLNIPIHYSVTNEFYNTIIDLYESNSPEIVLNNYFFTRKSLDEVMGKLKIAYDKKNKKEMKLARHLFRYTGNLAKKYGKGSSALIMDLIQEGCIAVIKAVYGFTPKFGTRINTYANILIKQDMLEHLSGIKHHIKLSWSQRATMGELEKQFGKSVTPEQVMSKLKCKRNKALALINNFNLALSLSQQTSSKDNNTINDLVADLRTTEGEVYNGIDDILDAYDFTEDEKKVIKFKFLNQVPSINDSQENIQKEFLRQNLFKVFNQLYLSFN